jgi:List-Bact-rpt repeat protein/lamin tail-like protein/flagellar hook capping protein FlgD
VVPAHGYFLIQQAAGGGGSTPLPTPDASDVISLDALSGKVALTSNSTVLSEDDPSGGAIEDLVGYGTANGSEASPAPSLSNTTSGLRNSGGCIDTDDNAADFTAGAPTPRNSASPTNDCVFTLTLLVDPDDSGTAAKTPDQVEYDAGTILSSIKATPADGYHFDYWSGDATGSSNPLLNVAIHSDMTITAHFAQTATTGHVVISQFFGEGGDLLGVGLKYDYVELFNRDNEPVNMAGWTLQYATADGTAWNSTPLEGSIQPKGYRLVRLFTGGQGVDDLPTPDVLGAIDLNPTQGKIAVVRGLTTLSGADPSSSDIADLVGYGGADGHETAPAPSPPPQKASFRNHGGCDDTDNNLLDFSNGDPAPRNSSSPENFCDIWLGVDTKVTNLFLSNPRPNPATGIARFSLELPSEGEVRVTVSDVQGRRVASVLNGHLPAGRHEVSWNGTGEAGPIRSGLYYLTLEVLGRRIVRGFVLMR